MNGRALPARTLGFIVDGMLAEVGEQLQLFARTDFPQNAHRERPQR
jgi:hypothetical protein